MTPKIIAIAEAVKDELNGQLFSQGFTAERHYQPVYELTDMKTLHVTVVPKGLEIEPISRAETAGDYQIDVSVQKKFTIGDNTELDAMMELVSEIADFLTRLRLTIGAATALWLKTENEPVFAAEHIEMFRQFTSVLTMTYRL